MIEIKNIQKTYTMGSVEVKALDGVSLKVEAGEFIAIVGPSGSGKSTMMHILGLLDRADAGTYSLRHKEVTGLSDDELASVRNGQIGFVFQQFHLLPRMSALENVELPLIYAGKRHLVEKARHELEEVGLGQRMRHRPSEMSGGQQQRVAIARALVNDPPIIMADEPTGNLDSKSKNEIMNILEGLNARGKTVIIVTHEKEIADRCRRIITMRDGKIISDERLNKVKQPAAVPVKNGNGNGVAVVEQLAKTPKKVTGGMKFLDYVREATFSMISHKMRAILSILGILIGVAAVIAMLALGTGAKMSIEKQLSSLGSNLLMIMPGSPKSGPVAMEAGTVTRFTFSDLNAITALESVSRGYGSVQGRGQMVYGAKNWNTQVQGVGVDFAEMRASVPETGRFFTEAEFRGREKVIVLGATVARELFGDSNPVGETVKLNLNNFKVVGVLPTKGASGWHDQDDVALIPLTTAMYRVFGKQYIDQIFVEAKGADSIDAAQEEVQQLVVKLHHLGKDDEDSFQIRNMSDIKNALESTTQTMTLLLGSIAAISLLVGGIGIMNIMLVSVTERTREIGLRKAIGATNKDIMFQFLIESVLLTLIGGLAGIMLGTGISVLITVFAHWSVMVSAFSIILSTAFSLVVGVVFGLWPARKASQLDPIAALRYE